MIDLETKQLLESIAVSLDELVIVLKELTVNIDKGKRTLRVRKEDML